MLTVIGGTYIEKCFEPYWNELYGSGLRGAVALSGHIDRIFLKSCIGQEKIKAAQIICSSFNINPSFTIIPSTILFDYYHPLSKPVIYPNEIIDLPKIKQLPVDAEYVLMYGQIESEVTVNGSYVVYDPQNWVSFKQTGSKAEHLALVLNRNEALYLAKSVSNSDLRQVGNILLMDEGAEVVVIKNGSQGAIVIDASGFYTIPIYDTSTIWPIGSGDVFSAAFAWQWALKKLAPVEAARLASQFTAQYCESKVLPLSTKLKHRKAIVPRTYTNKIYLAGPFFTISERWLINEVRSLLIEFGNSVFSPFHDVGIGISSEVVDKDLTAIQKADALLAIVSGLDAGTLFEIGYAKALKKRVIILAENVSEGDLVMLAGTDCEITSDFSTAIYKASW